LQRAILKHLDVAAFVPGDRQQSVCQLKPSYLYVAWVAAEIACELNPSSVKCLADRFEGFRPI
jgi:hypothetical protein